MKHQTEAEKLLAEITARRHADIATKQLAEIAGGHFTHDQVASRVRMLIRNQVDHEAVCVMARDRIVWLAAQLERRDAELAELRVALTRAGDAK